MSSAKHDRDPPPMPRGHEPRAPLATVLATLRQGSAVSRVDAQAVQQAFGLKSEYLASRLLHALDVEHRGFRSADDFVAAAQAVMEGDAGKKLDFLFRLHDEDGDGFIEGDELERLMHIGAAENDLRLRDSAIDAMAAVVMSAGDRDGNRRIGRGEFIVMMHTHPVMARRLTEYGASLLMPGKRARASMRQDRASLAGWLRNDLVWTLWLAAYALLNALLFVEAALRYRQAGATVFIQLARGGGACLNFNCALIVLPMLRHTLTAVRRSRLGALVPVDDAVRFHSIVGEVIVAFSVLHTVAHVGNLVSAGTDPVTRANVTGVALLLVLAVMWLCSRDFVRRSQRFELFHFTHLGYFAFVGLLFLHGPVFYLWATAPWLGFAFEKLLRARRRGVPCRVLEAEPLASGVTKLTLERPHAFWYAPGDYLFVCLPALARHEWHPFTLTSAPEDPERLTLHVRKAGNWTSALRERAPALSRSGELQARVDGPYGTASRHLLEVPHAIAIAGGIGVTPFASVLQSLLLRASDPDAERPALRKLHFVWQARDQHAFEWFSELLSRLEELDTARVLDLHIFMTAGRADMAGGLLELGQHLLGRRTAGDVVTGLRAPTQMGAPDFDRLLERFCAEQLDGATALPPPEVFFCGPTPLERVVKRTCHRLGLRLRAERF